MAKPSCRTTTGAQSPVPSVVSGSTTRTSATTSNASRRSSRPRTAVARAGPRATPTKTVARASPRAMAKAKVAQAKVGEEALTASRTRTRTQTSPEGSLILCQGGTLSPLVGNQTRDLQPVPRRKRNRNKGLSVPTKIGTSQNARKRSGFHAHGAETAEEGLSGDPPRGVLTGTLRGTYRSGVLGTYPSWGT